jgi:3-oxoacyl-[acyl-carrier-protein] synthase III
MSWQNIASQSAASASKVAVKAASEALEDFLNEEENQDKIINAAVSSIPSGSKVAVKVASEALEDFLK